MEVYVEQDPRTESPEESGAGAYDPPQVERVMDAEELAREVHYAGAPVPS
jgi:hypothetical protein